MHGYRFLARNYDTETIPEQKIADTERKADIRPNRVAIMKDQNLKEYPDLNFIKKEEEN